MNNDTLIFYKRELADFQYIGEYPTGLGAGPGQIGSFMIEAFPEDDQDDPIWTSPWAWAYLRLANAVLLVRQLKVKMPGNYQLEERVPYCIAHSIFVYHKRVTRIKRSTMVVLSDTGLIKIKSGRYVEKYSSAINIRSKEFKIKSDRLRTTARQIRKEAEFMVQKWVAEIIYNRITKTTKPDSTTVTLNPSWGTRINPNSIFATGP